MASVINSARNSTSSVFDLVGDTAEAAGKFVKTGSLAADALHVKARVMHRSVTDSAAIDMHLSTRKSIMSAASEYVDLLEEHYRHTTGRTDFDREAQTNQITAELQAAIDAEQQAA